MVDIGIGGLGYFGFGRESTDGTRVAPTKFLAVKSVNFVDSNDYITPQQIKQTRDISVAMPAPFGVNGTVELDLPIADFGDFWKSAWAGTVVTSAYTGGGYTHVVTPGNTSKTLSTEHSYQDQLVMSHSGIRVNTLEIKAAFGEIVSANLGLFGTVRAKQGSAATPTYDTYSTSPLHFNGATVSIGGSTSALVKSFTFQINNNMEYIGTLRKTRSYRRVALGPRSVMADMTLDFVDSAEYDRLLNDTEFALQLYLEGPAGIGAGGTSMQSITIDIPRVKYKTVGLPFQAGTQISQDVTCTVLKPSGGDIATLTINNLEADSAFAA